MSQKNQESDKYHLPIQNKKRLILMIMVPVLLGAGIWIGMNSVKEQHPAAGGVGFDPDASEYVETEDDDNSDSGVAIPGWGTLTIPADTTEITVDFYNPESNEGQYYLTFELRIQDGGDQGYEVLYSSGLVEPGLHIQEVTLSRGLSAGIYDAVIHVQPYRMDEERTPTNNAEMNTQLIVK